MGRPRAVRVLLTTLALSLGLALAPPGAAPGLTSSALALPPPVLTGPGNGATITQGAPITFSAYDATAADLDPSLWVNVSQSTALDPNGRLGSDVWTSGMSRSGSNWTTTYAGGPLALGTYYWQVYRIDYEPYPPSVFDVSAVWSFTISGPPPPVPETTISSPPDGPTNDNTPSFYFSSNIAGSTFECAFDGSGWVACSSPQTYATQPDGGHGFSVRATAAGQTDPSPDSRTLVIDTVAPSNATPSSPSHTIGVASGDSTIDVDWSGASDERTGIDGYSYEWSNSATTTPDELTDAEEFTNSATSPSLPGADDHWFHLRTRDNAGNWSGTAHLGPFVIDTAAPTNPTLSSPSHTVGVGSQDRTIDVVWSGAGDDRSGVDGFSYEWSNSPLTVADEIIDAEEGDGSATSPSLPDANDHWFHLRTRDNTGNWSATAHLGPFVIDNAGPETTITSGPDAPTNDNTPSFEFSSEAGATFECSLDGATWEGCASPKDYGVQADGDYTFRVRATDTLGNLGPAASRSFRIDTAKPAQPEITGTVPGSPANDDHPEVQGNAETGSLVRIYDDADCTGAPIGAGAWDEFSGAGITAFVAADHTSQLRATATDAAGNVSDCSTAFPYTEDSTGPATTITGGPEGLTNDNTPSFEFSSEAGATFECSLDGAAWESCASPKDYGVQAEGDHGFAVRATDLSGNTGPAASRDLTIDSVAPARPQIWFVQPSSPANDSTPEVFGSAASGTTVKIYDNATCAPPSIGSGSYLVFATSGVTATVPEDQTTYLHATATDAAGNESECSDGVAYTEDSTGPATTITSGPDAPTNDNTPSFEFSSEAGATFECSLDGATWEGCASPKDYGGQPDGDYTFRVRATDAVGNTGPVASRSFTIDTALPEVTIDSGPDGPTNDNTPTFEFSSDPGTSFECRLGGAEWSGCASPKAYAAQPDGDYTFEVRATDAAANTGPPQSRAFRIDTVAPETTITSGPAGPTADRTPSFEFSSEAGASFKCSFDGGAWEVCASPKDYPSQPDGDYTFAVRATDAAANTGTAATRSFTIDLTMPENPALSSPSHTTGVASNDATVDIHWSGASDGGSGIDGYSFEWSTSSTTAPDAVKEAEEGADSTTSPPLADGEHWFHLRTLDNAGNLSGVVHLGPFVIDSAGPATTIESGPDGATSDNTPSFSFSSEAGATFECSLDGAPWSACDSPKDYGAQADGVHDFEVRATDVAHNTGPAASRSFTIDTANPDTEITFGPAGTTPDPTPTFAFAANEAGAGFECRLDSDSFAPCTSPTTLGPLAPGSHTFQARAIDLAGNVDPSPATRDFTVEIPEPSSVIGWGNGAYGQIATPPGSDFTAIAAGAFHSLALRSDGSIAAWGINNYGQAGTPGGSDYVAIAAGLEHNLALTADGRIDGWGRDDSGQAGTPTGSDFVAIAAGAYHSLALRSNGELVSWGLDDSGQTSETPTGSDFVAIAAGGWHSLALRGDGSIVGWGRDAEGQTSPPAGTDFTAIASGGWHGLALRSDGSIAGWGSDDAGRATPPGGYDYAAVAAGLYHSLALRSDGSLAGWGSNLEGQASVPGGSDYRAIAAGGWHSLALVDDAIPPETTIDSGPALVPANSNDPSFSFHSSEARSSFECKLDGGAWSACESPVAYANVADGTHGFFVRATDNAGNTDPEPAERSFTIDTTPPDTAIESGPSGPTNDVAPSFGFSSSEAGSSFECRVDSGSWASCESPHTTAALADGSHTIYVRATDGFGNTDVTEAWRSFSVDTVPPETTILSGPSGPTNDVDPTFGFSSAIGSDFECRVDSDPWAPCSSPHTTAVLAEGNHSFEARAIDEAGNVDPTPATRAFTVDTSAPETTIDSGPSGTTNNDSPSFQFSSSEPGSSFECRLDGGSWFECSSPKQYSWLADGLHSFEVRAIDPAGNTDPTAAELSFTVDSTAPDTSIDTGPTGPPKTPTPTFTFSASDSGSSFECRVDSGSWASCGSPHTTAALADGSHTFYVRATDAAGNTDQFPAQRTFTVDAIAPETTINSGPSGLTANNDPSFGFSSEAGATFECKLDAEAWANCNAPKAYTDLADGAHTFSVRAIDAAGNVDPNPAERSFVVDTQAPDTNVDSGPAGVTDDQTPSFGFSSTEAGSSFECRLAFPWAPCGSPYTAASLANGNYSFEVRATDAAGNTDPSPAARSFIVQTTTPGPPDTTPPDTKLTKKPKKVVRTGARKVKAKFVFQSTESGSSFRCKLDRKKWKPCSSPRKLKVKLGKHKFRVVATDQAGNSDPTPAKWKWRVKQAPG